MEYDEQKFAEEIGELCTLSRQYCPSGPWLLRRGIKTAATRDDNNGGSMGKYYAEQKVPVHFEKKKEEKDERNRESKTVSCIRCCSICYRFYFIFYFYFMRRHLIHIPAKFWILLSETENLEHHYLFYSPFP
jgi:hypothetical protein